jgi:preprotein translocase subunit YajC
MNLLIVSSLLDDTSTSSSWTTYVFLGIIIVAFVAMFVWQSRKQKKQQAEQEATKNAIRPGNKVKTIGGVCGIVVEVNLEESTFVMETGSENAGKSYMKFDMQAIYQTDAKPEPTAADKDKKAKKEEKTETTATTEKVEEKAEEKAEKTEEKTEEQK